MCHIWVDLPQLCQAKGFVCEFCGNDKDIIFPFQLNKCQRCEGEPSLLVAGVCGSRAPSPRPTVLLNWRDWKSPKVRRLARALSQERREGEGGEDLELDGDEGEKSGEQKERGLMKEELEDTVKEKQERRGIFQAFNLGKLVKVFLKSKGNKEQKKMESEREGEKEQGGNDRGEVDCKERARNKEMGDEHVNREKVNLLKVLQIDRVKKSTSKGDQLNSDSEIFSSLESLNEVEQERKGRWKVSGLSSLAKGFTKKEREGEEKTEVKSSEKRFLEKVATKEEGKCRWEAEHDNETIKTESGAEKFTVLKLLKPQNLSTPFSRGNGKREEDKSGESDEKINIDTEDQGQPASLKQLNWRGSKTRKARRVTRGRKRREGMEKESKTESGERGEVIDTDDCTEREEQEKTSAQSSKVNI